MEQLLYVLLVLLVVTRACGEVAGWLDRFAGRVIGVYEQVQAGLSDDERATLVAALSTIIANLSDAETDTGRGSSKEVA